MKKLISALVLFLVSGAALADSSNSLNGIDIHGFAVAQNDLSIGFLGQVFGSVGNALTGTSGQMLGQLFKVFNEGVLVVAGLWLGYTTVTIALRSAQEGSFMGANRNVAVVLLRIALGITLAIPSPSTGYSLVQDIVMKVVVQGVGLADQTWDSALTYLQKGGALYISPMSSSNISNSGGQKLLSTAQTIFTSEVCMVASGDAVKQQREQSSGTTSGGSNSNPYVDSQNVPVNYTMQMSPNQNAIYFPGLGNTPGENPGTKATCGYVVGVGGAGKANTSSWLAMRQLAELLLPAAKRYYAVKSGNATSGTSSMSQDNSGDLAHAFLSYFNLIQPYARQINNKIDSSKRNFIGGAMKKGWIMAGRYYWDIGQITQSSIGLSSNLEPIAYSAVYASNNDGSALSQMVQGAKNAAYIGGGSSNFQSSMERAGANSVVNMGGNGGSGGHLIKNKILRTIAGPIGKLLSDFNSDNSNPISFLQHIGKAALNSVAEIWVAGIVLIAALGAAAGICDSTSPGGVIFSNTISWIKPIVVTAAGLLIVPGVILQYYLPLYPFILFTFGAIGWLVLVIEAMVAAPLVAFGLTHPEGHDFLGKAEQSLMLLLGIFIRPTLMIIGLIAAMLVSFVALKLVIVGFQGVMSDVFGGSSSSVYSGVKHAIDHSTSGVGKLNVIILVPVMLVIFTGIVYAITKYSFSLIHALPEKVMMWIGAPHMSDGSAQAANQIEGVASSAAKAGGDLAGGGVKGALGAAGYGGEKAGDKVREKYQSRKSADLTVKGGGK